MASTISGALDTSVFSKLMDLTMKERLLYGSLALVGYLFLASSLRFRRQQTIQSKYPYKTRASMSQMTDHDAWAIQKTILQMEFPFMVVKSLQFALFRVRAQHHLPFQGEQPD